MTFCAIGLIMPRRDREVGELLAADAAGAAGERVEQPEGRIGRRHFAEVALAHHRGRHR